MLQAVTVLAVDDEAKILETVQAYLAREGYTVLCASTGKEAQQYLSRNAVSLVLLDLMLPDLGGEEICRRIRSGFYDDVPSGIPIIMVTARADEASIIRGLNLGADDYVTKPFSPRELCARVKALLRRSAACVSGDGAANDAARQRVYTAGGLLIDGENRLVKRGEETIPLTAAEFSILALLASRPQKIFTRDEIINAVSGGDFDGFDRTVDAHVKNLRQKLGDNPRTPKYIETVYGLGYRIKA